MAKRARKITGKKFPHNSRYIPAYLAFLKYFLISLFSVSIIISAGYAYTSGREAYNAYLQKKHQKERLVQELQDWKQIADQRPGFRDAYLHMVVLNLTLGNIDDAYEELYKATDLDPNYKPTQELFEYTKTHYPRP